MRAGTTEARGIGFPGAGFTAGCEPSDVGAGSSVLLIPAPSLQAAVMVNFDYAPDWTCNKLKNSPVSGFVGAFS